MATSVVPPVCVPISLDAFVLNEPSCSASAPSGKPGEPDPLESLAAQSLVAPITQPNYQNLRLDKAQIQHDLVPNVDLHNASIGLTNPRISNEYSSPFLDARKNPEPSLPDQVQVDRKRLGVYVHWSIPRPFRSGNSEAAAPIGRYRHGDGPPPTNPQPVFPQVPNRWLVVRILKEYSPKEAKIDGVSAWVIESDRLRKVQELSLDENGQTIDLETDVSPYVAFAGDASNNDDLLNSQAENYLGFKAPLSSWKEQKLRQDQIESQVPPPGSGAKYVDLTIMNSSNPLFADYTPHNANVFSVKDNLYYGNGQYLESAICDYVVLGWHSDFAQDPLWDLWRTPHLDLGSRLKDLSFVPPPSGTDEDAQRLLSEKSTRLICHAAKFDVKYSSSVKPVTPGEGYAKNFTDQTSMEPVSIGTSPLDALLAFFQAHTGAKDSELDQVFGQNGKSTASTLMGLQELLHATEDDYDSRIKAADLIYTNDFSRSSGGFRWRYDRKKDVGSPPAIPSDERPQLPKPGVPLSNLSEVELLAKINDAQKVIDTAFAKLKLLQWGLFAEWFKYLSDPNISPTSQSRITIYASRIPLLRSEGHNLATLIAARQTDVTNIQKLIPVQKVAEDSYFCRNDPTLCLAGIDAGWNPQYLRNVPTRFVDRLSKPVGGTKADFSNLNSLLSNVGRFSPDQKVTPELQTLSATLISLLAECAQGYQVNLPEEQDTARDCAFKKWTAQPFAPQFIEWEGLYYHIPWSHDESNTDWDLQLTNSTLASSNHKQVMYRNPKSISGRDSILNDHRSISGRMLIFPQPSFALGAVVAQALNSAPKSQLPPDLRDDPGKRDQLIASAGALRFISGNLNGLTDGLLTLLSGQHVKPNLRKQGETTIPMAPAITAGLNISMNSSDFDAIGGESGKTPYGTLVDFDPHDPSPFKGVKHGQMAIRRLTVVDKFGQSIAVPLPKRTPRPGNVELESRIPDFVHPCLSERLMPGIVDGQLNTVYSPQQTKDPTTDSGVPMTPFVQINPSINQDARLNATFLQRRVNGETSQTFWQPCEDWENPIFGWIIVNFADSALQFFTADGTFYTSRQFGGPTGTIDSLRWLPFEPLTSEKSQAQASPQLISLLETMTTQHDNLGTRYLKTMWEIVQEAIPNMPFPPSEYAACANAIVGKPLALVNAGWSLELAQPPRWAQNTLPEPPAPVKGGIDPLRGAAMDEMSRYEFKVKIGDAERPFDGVVAYWDMTKSEGTSTETDFSQIFTYTDAEAGKDISTVIAPSNYPKLRPYYLDPDNLIINPKQSYTDSHTSELLVKTLLVDPYTPIHVYSGILPIKSLTIPNWSIQQALKNMTAFFCMGPLLLTKDVPSVYDSSKPLTPESWLDSQARTTSDDKPEQIKLPVAGGKGVWNWLQPYMVEGTPPPQQGGNAPPPETRYNSLAVGNEDGRIRQDPAPYTLVEGYLQLAKPLVPVDPETGVAKDQ